MDLGRALNPAIGVLVGGRKRVRDSHTQGEGHVDRGRRWRGMSSSRGRQGWPAATRGQQRPRAAAPRSPKKDQTLPTPRCWTSSSRMTGEYVPRRRKAGDGSPRRLTPPCGQPPNPCGARALTSMYAKSLVRWKKRCLELSIFTSKKRSFVFWKTSRAGRGCWVWGAKSVAGTVAVPRVSRDPRPSIGRGARRMPGKEPPGRPGHSPAGRQGASWAWARPPQASRRTWGRRWPCSR